MQYLHAYQYVFENKKWPQNLLFCALCMLIPIVGQLVLWGYLAEVMESLVRDETRPYPNFDFGRFGEYLKRGVWPFVVMLVAMLPAMPVFLVGMGVMFLGMILLREHAVAGGLLLVVWFPIHLALVALVSVFVVPFFIRAVLIQEFGASFSWTFFKDFLRRTFWEILLAWLFISVSGMIVGFAGMCLCLVGMYPAMALVTFAQFHLYYQLYKLYLERGGAPIPLKERSQK